MNQRWPRGAAETGSNVDNKAAPTDIHTAAETNSEYVHRIRIDAQTLIRNEARSPTSAAEKNKDDS